MDVSNFVFERCEATYLMYKANLGYSNLRRYLSISLRNGLVGKVRGDDGSVVHF